MMEDVYKIYVMSENTKVIRLIACRVGVIDCDYGHLERTRDSAHVEYSLGMFY